MDNYTSLTQSELDILFGVLAPAIKDLHRICSYSNLHLNFVTLRINGHSYRVGVDMYLENVFDVRKPMISIPCEVKDE